MRRRILQPLSYQIATAVRADLVRLQLLWPVALRLKASDPLALRSDRLDPIRELQHKLLQEFAGAIADELAVLIE